MVGSSGGAGHQLNALYRLTGRPTARPVPVGHRIKKPLDLRHVCGGGGGGRNRLEVFTVIVIE